MPRGARKESATSIYHVMLRGNNKEKIFISEEDKRRMRWLLSKYVGEKKVVPYAYAIMDNHIHLLAKCSLQALSETIHIVTTLYSQYFNERYGRIGHIFQDRFKSECVENERYFLTCIRYIHQNPVKAKMVHDCKQYRYSSAWEFCTYHTILKCDKIQKMYNSYFPTMDDFYNFHKQPVEHIVMDYEEDQNEYIKEMIETISQQYIKEHGVSKITKNQLVEYIKEKTGLSTRKIKEHLP